MTTLTASLDERVENLTAQVAALTAELDRQRAERDRKAELVDDGTGIVREALPRLVAELEQAGLTAEDLIGLLRTLARTVPDLRAALEQLAVLADLARTGGPLTGPVLDRMTELLAELEQRGYISFARSAAGVVDNVVTAFAPEDVEALGDNIVLILNTVKEMTQPEVMLMLRRTMHTVRENDDLGGDVSLLRLLRQMRDPDVKRGLARLLAVLRSMGEVPAGLVEERPTPTPKEG